MDTLPALWGRRSFLGACCKCYPFSILLYAWGFPSGVKCVSAEGDFVFSLTKHFFGVLRTRGLLVCDYRDYVCLEKCPQHLEKGKDGDSSADQEGPELRTPAGELESALSLQPQEGDSASLGMLLVIFSDLVFNVMALKKFENLSKAF